MEKEEKINHLETLKAKIVGRYLSESTIRDFNEIIQKEYINETCSKNPSTLYLKNLKLTINHQLKLLINSRKKPTNRITEFKEFSNNFKQDISDEISRLKY